MRALITVLTLIGLVPVFAQSPPPASRIVAIGDVHGAYAEYTTALRRAGLIDDQLKWSGGRTTLVQTGDYTDRGTDVRKVLDLLMQIEREAKAAGGMVLPLLGNHEVMNFLGDWRDVTPEICATFATPKSEQKREETWKQFERLKQGGGEPIPTVYQATREQWMEAHPPGCLEYREAMSPTGTYGRWLRQKDIAGEVASHLFMHAGLSPARPAPKSIAEVNERARAEITRVDNYRRRLVDKRLALPSFTLQQILEVGANELRLAVQALEKAKAENTQPAGSFDVAFLREAEAMLEIGKWSLLDPEGPLWFRGYAQWEEATTAPQVNALLDQLKLTRIVVGHTVTSDRKIQTRYGGRVVLMDTGMLRRVYEGTPSALEINGATLKAIYPDGEEVLNQK
jgi:Calcineurin-like phosphoesterase